MQRVAILVLCIAVGYLGAAGCNRAQQQVPLPTGWDGEVTCKVIHNDRNVTLFGKDLEDAKEFFLSFRRQLLLGKGQRPDIYDEVAIEPTQLLIFKDESGRSVAELHFLYGLQVAYLSRDGSFDLTQAELDRASAYFHKFSD